MTDLTQYHLGRAAAWTEAVALVEEWVRNTRPRYDTDLLARLREALAGAAFAAAHPATPAPTRRRRTPDGAA